MVKQNILADALERVAKADTDQVLTALMEVCEKVGQMNAVEVVAAWRWLELIPQPSRRQWRVRKQHTTVRQQVLQRLRACHETSTPASLCWSASEYESLNLEMGSILAKNK